MLYEVITGDFSPRVQTDPGGLNAVLECSLSNHIVTSLSPGGRTNKCDAAHATTAHAQRLITRIPGRNRPMGVFSQVAAGPPRIPGRQAMDPQV